MKQILFVDDDPDIRSIAQMSLTIVGGWQVKTAASGPEAIAIADAEPPDVIMLDVMMPGMDGLTTLQGLRASARTASIPVIFLTAKVQKDELDRYRAAGAGLIAKPFDPMTLPREVSRLLEGLPGSPVVESTPPMLRATASSHRP